MADIEQRAYAAPLLREPTTIATVHSHFATPGTAIHETLTEGGETTHYLTIGQDRGYFRIGLTNDQWQVLVGTPFVVIEGGNVVNCSDDTFIVDYDNIRANIDDCDELIMAASNTPGLPKEVLEDLNIEREQIAARSEAQEVSKR